MTEEIATNKVEARGLEARGLEVRVEVDKLPRAEGEGGSQCEHFSQRTPIWDNISYVTLLWSTSKFLHISYWHFIHIIHINRTTVTASCAEVAT